MNDFKLSPKAMVMIQGSSKGTQPKFYENGYWYKQNINGYEGKAEHLCSVVLSCSNVKNYVIYEECNINNRKGCRSASFLAPNESFLSFERLHEMAGLGHIDDAIRQFSNCKDRISYIKEFLLTNFNYDCSNYLSQILSLDMLTLNCDRHFNNLGVVINNETGICEDAPIFDNGDSLFSNFAIFNKDAYKENLEKVIARPFSISHERQALDAGIGLSLDYDLLNKKLKQEPGSRALDVLYIQLDETKRLIPDIKLEISATENEIDIHNDEDYDEDYDWDPADDLY